MASFTICSVVLLVFVCCVQEAFCASGSGIASYAQSKKGSRTWLYSGSHVTGRNTNKCNIFVADVLKSQRANAPERWFFKYSPIGAREWGNPQSSYLKGDDCWDLCSSSKQRGDVIAEHGHVGIVTGYRKTTSASAAASPPGLIVENDWGFRTGQNPTCWRFNYRSC